MKARPQPDLLWRWIPPILAVGIWSYAAYFFFVRKLALLDDCFLYLQVAANVFDTGTARLYPIAENAGLVASSPLRLLVLLPSTLLARAVEGGGARTIEAARTTLFVTGPLTCAAFLPFFRARLRLWWMGMFLAGVLAVCTESALQMEGLLVFWCAYTLLALASLRPTGQRARPVAIVVGLFVLARPEYGLPVALVTALVLAVERPPRELRTFAAILLACGLGWILVAVLLRVYPIPTTLLTKYITAKTQLFGPSVAALTLRRVRLFFFGGRSIEPAVILGLTLLFLLALWTRARIYRAASVALVLVGLLARQASGNYLWYHENLYIAVLTVAAGFVLLDDPLPRGRALTWQAPATAVAALVWLLFVTASFSRNRPMPWAFRDERSRGNAYVDAGRHYRGEGLFQFGEEIMVLGGTEIGIASYFAGPEAWMLDTVGLAQPGILTPTYPTLLEAFYPDRLLVAPRDEIDRIDRRYGRRLGSDAVWKLYCALNVDEGTHRCDTYFPETGVCLVRLPGVPMSPFK